MQDILISRKVENRHLTETGKNGRLVRRSGGHWLHWNYPWSTRLSTESAFTPSGEAASQEQKPSQIRPGRDQRDPGEEEEGLHWRCARAHPTWGGGQAGGTPEKIRSHATGRGGRQPWAERKTLTRDSGFGRRTEQTVPRWPQPRQKCAGLLENVSRMGQRTAKTYYMTSVLLVQETEPLLSHRTQKTTWVTLNSPKDGT